MLSLVSACAQKVVSDHASLRQALDSVPRELYPPLFAAAVAGGKTLVLQDLVQRWPFPVLSFRELLRGHPNPSREATQTVVLGVMASLTSAERGHHLRLLDLTGARNAVPEQGTDAVNLWSRTVTLAKACISLSKRRRDEARQAAKRRRGLRDSTPAQVEVRTDLFVNSASYSVLREALQARGPLRLRCRDLRAEELSLRGTVGLLELLEPAGVRQIDLRYNNLGLDGLNAVLPAAGRFGDLRSLKLPYSNVDIRRLGPDAEDAMRKFATLIGRLTSLKELNLGSSRLSGRLRQLLGEVAEPLESLELAFCSLLPGDLYYLSGSLHASALKKVDLSGNNLSELLLPPFLQLLSASCPSLQHLDVMECKLGDSALPVLMPALCRCTRLLYLGLSCNPLSSGGVKTLLHRCLGLPRLRLVVYPYPTDCYPDPADLYSMPADQEKLTRFAAELGEAMATAGRADVVWTTDMCLHRNLDYLDL